MTFPKLGKMEDLMNKSNFVLLEFVCFYLDREKCAFSKIAFQVRSKVHFVRLIFRSRGKFTLEFLEPVQIFFSVFFCARNRFKKKPQRLGPRPSQQAGRLGPSRARQAPGEAAASPLGRVLVGLRPVAPPLSFVPFSFSSRIPFPTLFLVPYPKKPPPLPNINTPTPPL